MAFLRAFFAVLAALVTLVAVVAIKRGVEWGLTDVSGTPLDVIGTLVIGPFVIAGAWLWLLRPRLLRRRQQREDASLRQGRVGDAGGERIGAAPNIVRLQEAIEDARASARRGARQG